MKIEDNVCERFGKKIKAIRNDRKISQEKFALSIGLDRTYYSSVENGKRNISLNNINKIADGFGMTLSELFREL